MTSTRLIFIASVLIGLIYNLKFYEKVIDIYPISWKYSFFLLSVMIVLIATSNIVLNLISFRKATKIILIINFLIASIICYVTSNYGIVIDDTMILNVLSTNIKEALDLFNLKFLIYFFFLGLIPSYVISKIKLKKISIGKEVTLKAISVVFSIVIALGMIATTSKTFASFFRQHKPLRSYVNPTFSYYSVYKYSKKNVFKKNHVFVEIGRDAKVLQKDNKRNLAILIIGETARGDHFSLNGYERKTNPLLEQEKNIVSFDDHSSCGTSTAISVPCMFSYLQRSEFSYAKANSQDNLLDILKHTGEISVLWRDNNSDSKGVAARIDYQDFKSPKLNKVCDIECRDVGMLGGLQEYIDEQKSKNIFIVLHQMGSHGPAYYKRYPKKFEKFLPTCQSDQLENCTVEEITNTYDNTIFYTDYFLSEIIKLLKQNSEKFKTAMIYNSDHGESLGENGVYLHGMPYHFAPEAQKNSALIVWMGESNKDDSNLENLRKRSKTTVSHDNLFHSVLGLMEVQTSIYNSQMDIFSSDFETNL